jgi:hypothetical protein
MWHVIDSSIGGVIALLATTAVLPTYTLDVDQIDGWLRVAGEIGAVVFFVWQVRKRADQRTAKKDAEERAAMEARIIASLEKRTQPIQPKYRNDGESLADIANEVKRQREALAETNVLLTSTHKIAAETSVELTTHRLTTAAQFAELRATDDRFKVEGDELVATWRVALESQGITLPPGGKPTDSL